MDLEMVPPPGKRRQHKELIPGEAVRAAREQAAITQLVLASRLDVEPATVSRWETGKAKVYRSTWVAVLGACGLPYTWKP